MHLYLAAIYTNKLGLESAYVRRCRPHVQEQRRKVRHILESYHYVGHSESFAREMRRDGAKVFLDSGAFSAFTLGKEIDLDAYCRFIRDNKDIILMSSVLDGIGDPQKTYENQMAMEAQGVDVLPCFHYGEDERYLEFYVDRYPYITLGGMVPIAKPQLETWLDRIWRDYLCDSTGQARVKVHGFGMTNRRLMARYPWFSVDSSSWLQITSFGGAYLPRHGPIQVSRQSPSRKVAGRHIDTLPAVERNAVLHELRSRGFELDEIAEDYVVRFIWNMLAFTELNDIIDAILARRGGRLVETQPVLFP